MKKAFSLMEIIIAIIVISVISYYSVMKYIDIKKQEAVKTFLQKIDAVVSDAVTDPAVGYVNGTGGYCSDDSSYTGLTAKRAIYCVGWQNSFAIGGKEPASYVYKLLTFDSISPNGCYVYLREPLSGDSSNIFYMYINCANYNGNKTYIEDMISAEMKRNFSTIIKNIDYKATGINYSSTAAAAFYDNGIAGDGKIGFKFQK